MTDDGDTVFFWQIKMPLVGASQQSQQGHSWDSKHGSKQDYMWYYMTKHVFNSDSRLIGIFGEKNFENFFLEIILFNGWNFWSHPIRRAQHQILSNKKNLTKNIIEFDIPKYLIHEISFNIVPIAIYTPICTINW